jgi:antitoxin MazE
MVSRIQGWGNSQGLRLPKHILQDADLSVGDNVEVIPQEGQILIKEVAKRRFDLAEMVSRMPRAYRVRGESFGKPVGKEEW